MPPVPAWRSTLPPAAGFDLAASVDSYPRQWATVPGMVKVQEDLDRYAHVITATQPEVLVECGTWSGRSAAWFAGHGLDVVSIDLNPPRDEWKGHPRVTWVEGSSTSPAVVALVASIVEGRRATVVLDSDHAPMHVAAEMADYGPLVAPGCYMVVEDGICRFVPGTPVTDAGPLDAIEAFLPCAGWERDVEVEGLYPVTHHPAGWLRRLP